MFFPDMKEPNKHGMTLLQEQLQKCIHLFGNRNDSVIHKVLAC